MNLDISPELETFMKQVLLPTYTLIQEQVQNLGYSVSIITNFPTGDRSIDAMLSKMHALQTSSTKPLFSAPGQSLNSQNIQQQIRASLVVDFPVNDSITERSYIKRYCLSIKLIQHETEPVHIKFFAIGTTPQNSTHQPFFQESEEIPPWKRLKAKIGIAASGSFPKALTPLNHLNWNLHVYTQTPTIDTKISREMLQPK
jgi:hypothetical protein